MEKRVVRRLAAVFAASVVNHGHPADALKDPRQTALETQIAAYRGRIVKATGDGLLAEFSSLVDAADCACSVQRQTTERNAALTPERRFDLRIGINLGDVIIDGGDMFGDGVNIATWLGSLAEPGGICVSKVVMDQLRDRRGLDFHDLGEHSVKDIARPLRTYRLSSRADPPDRPLPQAAARAPTDHPSIAVLPFANMTGDAEHDYFAEGIAEDIITALSQLAEFFVMAHGSSLVHGGTAIDVRQIARELGVRYVLEGSVCRTGSRLHVTSRLIEAASRTQLWTGCCDGAIDDVFGVQDRITKTVIDALAPRLRQAEIERARGAAG